MADSQTTGPLDPQHQAAGAVMGTEGGLSVPLHYGDPADEARAVRAAAGLLDLSHLGRIRIRGDGALDLLERVCTADVAGQEDETFRPTLLCNESGGVMDAAGLIRLQNFWVLTTSAGNREKVLAHLQAQDIPGVKVDDQSTMVAHLAVAGPDAAKLLDDMLPVKVSGLPEGGAKMGSLWVANYIAVRTGYLGEWAMEVMIPANWAARAWQHVAGRNGEGRVRPAGMTARDILRIEAGQIRYGHEVHEAIDPISAGLGDWVDRDHDFLGREAIEALAPPTRTPRGLVLEATSEAKIPRMGMAVFDADGREIGTVTSGTFSPHLDAPVALASVVADVEADREAIRLDTPDGPPGRLAELPLYRPGLT